MIGEREVMMTLPAPANPYLIPKNELTIKAMFKTELAAIYLRELKFNRMGSLKKYKIGKKARLMIKKRQKMMTSIGSSKVRILSAVQPPPQRSMANVKR